MNSDSTEPLVPRLVIIADLVASRSLAPHDRAAVQNAVLSAADFALVSTILGDEFELTMPADIDSWRQFWAFRMMLQAGSPHTPPTSLRAGIGLGEVYVDSDTSPRQQDGPAYHRARQAINLLREHEQSSRRRSPQRPWDPLPTRSWRTALFTNDNDAEPAEVLNTTLAMLDAVTLRWTPLQLRANALWVNGWDYRQIAHDQGVSTAAVQARLQSSELDLVLRAIESMGNHLGLRERAHR